MPNDNRYLPSEDVTLITHKTRMLSRAVGSNLICAEYTRVAGASIQRYGDVTQPEMMPIDIVIELESVIDKPIMTEYMANRLGYGLYKLPQIAGQGEAFRQLAEFIGKHAETIKDLSAAYADGKLTKDEIKSKDMVKEMTDVRDMAMGYLAIFEDVLKDGGE